MLVINVCTSVLLVVFLASYRCILWGRDSGTAVAFLCTANLQRISPSLSTPPFFPFFLFFLQTRFNIPCHITDISCGMACGKDLPCGEHKCVKICHRGACMDSPGQCRQPCQTHRKFCAHICGEPCHIGSECPDVPCKVSVH